MLPEELIPEKKIIKAWSNANFGEEINNNKRELVNNTLLKYACGMSSGHTAFSICMELGLLKMNSRNKVVFTAFGHEYLYSVYSKSNY